MEEGVEEVESLHYPMAEEAGVAAGVILVKLLTGVEVGPWAVAEEQNCKAESEVGAAVAEIVPHNCNRPRLNHPAEEEKSPDHRHSYCCCCY